jgi:N-acetylglucosaminyldiphosphoundecaprenol N-acetyl-beta-D-mannosaminyltransferase
MPINRETMNILGLNMRFLSYEEMFLIFDDWLSEKLSCSHTITALNVNTCVSSLFSRNLRAIYNSADIGGIDSMPFLFWARSFYKNKCDRFYAPDLMLEVSKKAEQNHYTFFLFGGYPDAPEKIETYLKQQFNGINVVGKYSPPFRPLSDEEDKEICDMINAAKPDFLWVGLGSPKQDIWIHNHKNKLRGCIIIPAGATFDFFSGKIKQAPKWIRDFGVEWLFRLFHDFKRLWKRYTVYNVVFVCMFFLQLIKIVAFDNEGFLLIFGKRNRFFNKE